MKDERHRVRPLSLYFQWAKHEHLSYYNLYERYINRVHLTFTLHTNCQNRPCGKEFNTTAFVNLLICKHYTVKKLKYRIHEVISTEWLTSLSTSIKSKYCLIKKISHYSIDAPGQLLKVIVAYWAPTVMSVPQKARQYFDFILVDNEVSHSVEITSWIRYLSFFTV
jgi:hypothetical protein